MQDAAVSTILLFHKLMGFWKQKVDAAQVKSLHLCNNYQILGRRVG